MKILENKGKNAEALLDQSMTLLMELDKAVENCIPFSSEKVRKGGLALPLFVAQTRKVLVSCKLSNFSAQYPALSANAIGADSVNSNAAHSRLINTLVALSKLNAILKANNYALKNDSVREEASVFAKRARGCLAAFIIGQYGLHNREKGIQLAVASYLEILGKDADFFYDTLYKVMLDSDEDYYGYEDMSPYYTEMYAHDPQLLAEAEHADFPLTSDICKALLDGDITDAHLQLSINEYQKQNPRQESDAFTPTGLVKELHLD